MSISTKQLAALGWTKTNPGAPTHMSCYRHESGWWTEHCGHPTALYPYLLRDPQGKPVPAPSGRAFQNMQKVAEWLHQHLTPELIEGADEGRADALAVAQREEMEALMRKPIANVSAASGEMERNSPLFFGQGDNPTLF